MLRKSGHDADLQDTSDDEEAAGDAESVAYIHRTLASCHESHLCAVRGRLGDKQWEQDTVTRGDSVGSLSQQKLKTKIQNEYHSISRSI